jgi:hypothetical protein
MKNYFPDEERECHCGCGINNPSLLLMDLLNTTRHRLGEAIYATSICRCPEHNSSLIVGGSPTSSHITTEERESLAADLTCQTGEYRLKLVKELIGAGFERILIYPMKLHVDIDRSKSKGIFPMENK